MATNQVNDNTNWEPERIVETKNESGNLSSSSCSSGSNESLERSPVSVPAFAVGGPVQRVFDLNDPRDYAADRPVRTSRNVAPKYKGTVSLIEIVDKAPDKKTKKVRANTLPKKLTPRREKIILRFLREDGHGPVESKQWKQQLIKLLSHGTSRLAITSGDLSHWLKTPSIKKAFEKRKKSSVTSSDADKDASLAAHPPSPSDSGEQGSIENASRTEPLPQALTDARIIAESVKESGASQDSIETANHEYRDMEQPAFASVIAANPNSPETENSSQTIVNSAFVQVSPQAPVHDFQADVNSFTQYRPITSPISPGLEVLSRTMLKPEPVRFGYMSHSHAHFESTPDNNTPSIPPVPVNEQGSVVSEASGHGASADAYSQLQFELPALTPQPSRMYFEEQHQLPYGQLPAPTGENVFRPLKVGCSSPVQQSPYMNLDEAIQAWQACSREMVRIYSINKPGLITIGNLHLIESFGSMIQGVADYADYLKRTLSSSGTQNQ